MTKQLVGPRHGKTCYAFAIPSVDFRNFLQYCAKDTTLNIIEVLNTLLMVVYPFIYLLGHLFHNLNAFLLELFDILIQIFRNLQNLPRSWIAKVTIFSMSGWPNTPPNF